MNRKLSTKIKSPLCPKYSKNDRVIPIIYGMPAPEAFEEVDKGEIKLGGCIIEDCNKYWHCKRDNLDFNAPN